MCGGRARSGGAGRGRAPTKGRYVHLYAQAAARNPGQRDTPKLRSLAPPRRRRQSPPRTAPAPAPTAAAAARRVPACREAAGRAHDASLCTAATQQQQPGPKAGTVLPAICSNLESLHVLLHPLHGLFKGSGVGVHAAEPGEGPHRGRLCGRWKGVRASTGRCQEREMRVVLSHDV